MFVSFASILSLLFDFWNVPGEPPVYSPSVISVYGGLTAISGVVASLICAVLL